jgi:rubrerythrin
MNENSVASEALCQAARLEEDGYKFYTEAAKRTADPQGREMFLSLADDEKMHLRMVEGQYEAVMNEEEWISFPGALECKPIDLDKPLFPPEGHGFDEVVDPAASDLDALLFALQIENESYELYRQAAAEVTDPAGQAMYELLATEARTHFDILMLNYEHLASTGIWRGLV